MYKCPIEIFQTQMRMEYEDGVLKCVQNFFPNVDKDELYKALKYDRQQYSEGYADGYIKGATELADKLKQWVIESSNYWFSATVNAEIDEILKEMINR